jgi:putative ABC transport system substrate-binding protein
MRRRAFMTLLGGAAAWPGAAHAQKASLPMVRTKLPIIGVLGVLPSTDSALRSKRFTSLRNALAENGLVEGRDYLVEIRSVDSAQFQQDQIAAQVADLLQLGVAVFITFSLPQTLVAKASTNTIPIIFQTGTDPVAAKLVASLNSPGGNLTGVFSLETAVIGKRLEILHELTSNASSFALLVNPTNKAAAEAGTKELQLVTNALGVRLIVLNISKTAELEDAFATMVRESVEGVVVGGDSLFFNSQSELVSLAAHHKMPSIYQARDFVAIGGLASFGAKRSEILRICALYAARILRGENPANLPVQQATRTELVINLKTARAIDLEVSSTLLARTDEVIE